MPLQVKYAIATTDEVKKRALKESNTRSPHLPGPQAGFDCFQAWVLHVLNELTSHHEGTALNSAA